MAVFRSIENGVPTVRSTASGLSCIINSRGKIERTAPEFCQAFVLGDIEIIDDAESTLFTKYGDWMGQLQVLLAGFILIMQTFIVIIKTIKNHR
jgi:apolipoprotein N-acyltransferase